MHTLSRSKTLLERIGIDQRLSPTLPCLKKHQVYVCLVLDMLDSGYTPEQLIRDHPFLDESDILACLIYGLDSEPKSKIAA